MKQKRITVAISLMLMTFAGGCAANQQAPSQLDMSESAPVIAPDEKKPEADTSSTIAPVKISSPTPVETPAALKLKTEDAPLSVSEEKKDRYKLHPGSGIFIKPTPGIVPSASAAGAEQEITLNFEGAEIREVVKVVLGDVLKESYILDPRVKGSITVRSSKPIARNALLPTIEMLLRMNGAAMVREANGVFKIIPAGVAVKGSTSPRLGGGGRPLADGHSLQVVPLQYVGAREMAKILEPLAPEGGGGVLRVDEARNLLILSGAEPELRHALETIDMFDMDWMSGMSAGLFPLKHSDAKVVNAELDKLFGDKSSSPTAGLLRIVPIERMNALLIVTQQPRYLDQAKLWVERLDQGGSSGGSSLHVYQVQNSKAENIANLISDIFGWKRTQQQAAPQLAPGLSAGEVSSTPFASSQPVDNKTAMTGGFGQSGTASTATLPPAVASSGSTVAQSPSSDVRVIADKDNNALLIYAPPGEYDKIEAAIKKLDVVPRQVLIEMTIAEIALTDEYKFGLEWFFKNNSGKGQLDTGLAGITQLVPGLSYVWNNKAGDVQAILNALGTTGNLNIISSPHVMVSDNQVAKIQVGDRVPTVSQTQSTASTVTQNGLISSIQYIDTGVMLSVRPHINAGGQVTMEISQEVSNAKKTVTSGIDSPTIGKRTAQSTVTIQSGDTMVLGGLIREEKDDGTEGVPLLSELPFVGSLFGVQSKKTNRTELIILITPRVANNRQQTKEITSEIRERVSGLQTLAPHKPGK
jgi:general secretion pathway protein D